MAFFISHSGFKRLLVLGSALAAAVALVADASGASRVSRGIAAPDVFERYAALHGGAFGAVPDLVERYAAAHPSTGTLTPAGTDRIVDDWFRDPAPIVTPAGDRIVDDSFRDAAPAVSSTANGSGLDWADVGIGAGAMLGLTLLLIGLGLGALAMRHRTGKLEAS